MTLIPKMIISRSPLEFFSLHSVPPRSRGQASEPSDNLLGDGFMSLYRRTEIQTDDLILLIVGHLLMQIHISSVQTVLLLCVRTL